MKKIYAILAALVLLIVVGAWWLFSNAFSWANYTNELADLLANALKQNALSAEYNGETHPIGSDSVDGVLRVLRRGASEVKSVQGPPETYDGKVTLRIGDTTLNIYRERKGVDRVVMERMANGRSSCTTLENYEMFKWILRATGFEEEAGE